MKLIRVLPLFTVSRLLNALLPYNAVFRYSKLALASKIVDLILTLAVC